MSSKTHRVVCHASSIASCNYLPLYPHRVTWPQDRPGIAKETARRSPRRDHPIPSLHSFIIVREPDPSILHFPGIASCRRPDLGAPPHPPSLDHTRRAPRSVSPTAAAAAGQAADDDVEQAGDGTDDGL